MTEPKPLTGMAFVQAELAADEARIRAAVADMNEAIAAWRVLAEQECADIEAEAMAPLGGAE